MLAVERDRVGTGRINHDGSVEPCLLLFARMAVIPVGARLQDREFVYEGRTRLGAGTVPLTPIAGVVIPSMTSFILSIVSAMFVPDTVGRGLAMPRDTGCAQAGR